MARSTFCIALACVAVAFLLGTCNAAPAAQSKLPNTLHLSKDAKDLALGALQELSDLKSDIIVRQSQYDSRRLKLEASLNLTQHLAGQRDLLEGICQAHADLLLKTQKEGEVSLNHNSDSTSLRELQMQQHHANATVQEDSDSRKIGDLLNIKRKITLELTAEQDARGNGINFDQFVVKHERALHNLKSINELASKLQVMIEEKQRHTSNNIAKLEKALACPECSIATNVLAKSFQKHTQEATSLAEICNKMEKEPNLSQLKANILDLQTQLFQLSEDEGVQKKAEDSRKTRTQQQIASVKSLGFFAPSEI